ncbi:MAG TPA: putative Ig domain-containing protein, partial [Lysobacter sp.]
MSAVISGNGLGLFDSSLLGGGAGGSGQVGLGSHYVNIANGNLVLQSQDEQLLFKGLSIAQLRTYNSLGTVGQIGADGWLTGFERRVELLSGTFNTANSVMRRHAGDGSYQDFTWIAADTYRSTAGDGAHDTLAWASGTRTWTYVEGSTRAEERYADHADAVLLGRLTRIGTLKSDGAAPSGWLVLYDANQRISEIRADGGTADGDALVFGYGASGRLESTSTREDGVVRGQVQYGYDGQGRLLSVLVDLTPQDGSGDRDEWDGTTAANNDGYLFRTTYTYVDATSLRIGLVQHSDGTVVSYTYDSAGRVQTVTHGDTNTNDADGLGETLSYEYSGNTTRVTDSLGRAWTYAYNAERRLESVTSPAVSGQSDVTTYSYDATGNLTQIRTVRGAQTLSLLDYQYDANGNVVWQWDAQGNALQRTYSATNQVLSETRYIDVDPDRSGNELPTNGVTVRYTYDNRDRIRFVVDATGFVTEYEYATVGNGIGQQASVRRYLSEGYAGAATESALVAWATSSRRADSAITELAYDLWGRLSQTVAYAAVDSAGNGILDNAGAVTRFHYDAQGLLRQQVTLRGAGRTLGDAPLAGSEVVDYVYDGMGRLLGMHSRSSEDAANDDAVSVSTTYAYLDSGHQLAVSLDSGRVRTETRNAAGRVVSVSEAGVVNGGSVVRASQRYYDSAGQLRASDDASGARTYFFYDAKGRLEATVDGTGAVTRLVYDGADRVLQTTAYASRVTTTGWLVAGAVSKAGFADIGVIADAVNDRNQYSTYDSAGRLSTQVDAAGTITTYTYDAADRLVQVKVTDAAQTAATARATRYFHDDAGREIARLDAEGYLTETAYDVAGRPVKVTRYATRTAAAQWAAGTLAQLRPTAAEADQITRTYYDARGHRVGELDAAGYVTEWIFDEAGHARAERRYSLAVTWQATDTFATVRARAGGTFRESRMAYNGRGQLTTQTNPEGTVTRYAYDEAGRLVRTELAHGTTEVREGYRRYNVFDELVGEIDGEGAEQARTALGGKTLDDPTLTQAQLDLAYAAFGIRHEYDTLGRRIESIDAAGNKTWMFYDAAGRPTFVVRGIADGSGTANAQGEVVETRYNAFGQARETFAYSGRITLAMAGSRASAATAIAALTYASATDTRRQFAYTTRGLLNSITDATGAQTRYVYNAFGELTREESGYGSTASTVNETIRDRRGLVVARVEGSGSAVERSLAWTHDAFGRVVAHAQGQTNGHAVTTSYGYDRLGRQITTQRNVLGRTEAVLTSYDAYSRVVTVTDADNRISTYAYDTSNRSMVVSTPQGTEVRTVFNRHGQAVTVSERLAADRTITRTYAYDASGRLLGTTDDLGHGEHNEYDARGLLSATVDATGRRVELHYDAAGRVLRRVEDPSGLALTTRYTFDGQGRSISVTDPTGRVTAFAYDGEGRLLEAVINPAGLNLRTVYAYDAQGRTVSVTDAAGTTTRYDYDALGRRTAETVDPNGLALTTQYFYDQNDHLVRRIDASGAVTRYAYDEAGRLIHTVDARGGVTRQWHDAAGRVVASRTFAASIATSTLTDATTVAALDALLVPGTSDEGGYFVYDEAGRLRWSVGIDGSIVESVYAAGSQLLGTRRYATRIALNTALRDSMLAGTARPADIQPAQGALDEQVWYVLDATGLVRFTVDANGNVVESYRDDAGRLVGTRAYAVPIALDTLLRDQLRAGTATVATLAARVENIDDDARDLRSYTVRDAAGRERYSVDAFGAVSETLLDASGRVVGVRRYAVNVLVDGVLLERLKSGTATVADIAGRLAPDAASDRREYFILDAAGRMVLRVDGGGYVHRFVHDSAGRVVSETRYAIAANIGTTLRARLDAGTATEAEVLAVTTTNGSADRNVRYVRDSLGQVRYTLTADAANLLAVVESRHDAMGRVVAEVAYGVRIGAATPATEAGVVSAIAAAGGHAAANQRLTQYVLDGNGRLRYTIDALGYVTERVYDGIGRLLEERAFDAKWSGAASEAALGAALVAPSRRSLHRYDTSGRLVESTDVLGYSEDFSYDALGRLVAYTDKLDKIWTYEYDAAGRRTRETSPLVEVTDADTGAVVSRAVVTDFQYDALGNLVARIDNATGGAGQVRTTRYTYDNRGHQVRTEYVGLATVEVTYDALGQAVVQKDVLGFHSYRTYDVLGRLAYEVDQEGFVTSYAYNAYGEQTEITRHAQRLNTTALSGWSAGQPMAFSQLSAPGVVPTAGARKLQTAYDQLGRKVSVTQPSVSYVRTDGSTAQGSPVTRFAYDAYGQLLKESVLLQGTPGQPDAAWADTHRYYDAMGRVVLQVDAEGFATAHAYNAHGDVVETIEYARALDASLVGTPTRPGAPAGGDAVSGYDRITRWTYDALGRRNSETAVRHYQRTDGSSGVRDVTVAFGYDAEDRLVTASGEQGTITTRYDALGRVLSVAEPQRTVLKADAEWHLQNSTYNSLASDLYEQVSPYAEMGYDAFGNLVRTRRFANGLRTGQSVGVRDDNRDQVEITGYDVHGRAVMTRSAGGKTVYSQYDAAGHVTSSSYFLNGSTDEWDAWIDSSYTYDKLGRQLTSHQKRRGAERSELDETVSYNAFGEIIGKTFGVVSGHVVSGALVYVYDDAGRLVSSNETGQVRQFGYNLAGHQQRELHSAYLSSTLSVDAITYTVTDRLGRTIGVRMPAYGDTLALTAQTSQRLDRWGNVLQINDARGYRTNYRYNDFNQLIRDERPLVLVVGEDASRVWSRPVNQWYYDAFGRLVATRDANGNVRTNEYDTAGNLLRYTDALNHSTRYAYDVLGNERMVENARGYITYKEYDLQGRVVRIGDYLPDSGGQWRGKAALQQYILNENGDRTRVFDALTYEQRYDYDGSSRLRRSVTAMGVTLDYTHDLFGHKASETNELNDRLSWDYDAFGRLVDHRNLSGRDYDYSYAGNLLTSEYAAGGPVGAASKAYRYYANGMIAEILDGGLTYRYVYDAGGNRIEESTVGTDANGLAVNIVTRTVYDSHNRVQRVTQDDAGKRIFDVLYEYDAVGNRRHVLAYSGYGPGVPEVPKAGTAPVVVRNVADRTVRKGRGSEFRILFSDVFRDAEQNRLSLSVSVNDGVPPSWLQYRVDADTGEIVFTANPPAGLADQDIKVKLIATESETNEHYSASTEFFVRVRDNSAPELVVGGTTTLPRAKIGKSWTQSLAASDWFGDVDVGDRLGLTVVNGGALPAWLQIDSSNPDALHLSGVPDGVGVYELQVRATDEAGASVIKTFVIDAGHNRAPTGTTPAPREAILGRAFEWNQPAASVFNDADGDALSITATGLPGWMSFQYLADRAQPQLRLSGQVPPHVADGTVYSITITATDPDGAAHSVTMQVTARHNRGPIATDWTVPPIRVHDNYNVAVPITTLFNDPEGDPLTITTSGAPAFVTVSLDAATRMLRFTATPAHDAQAGDYTFQVTARDGEGLSSTATVYLHVGPDRPPTRDTSVPLGDQWASVGRPFAFQVPANLYYDQDGDAYNLVGSVVRTVESTYFDDANPPGQWVTIVETFEDPLPYWIHFDPVTRTFSGTVPPGEPVGEIKIRVSAFDGRLVSWAFDARAGAGVYHDDIVVLTIVPLTNHPPVYNGGLPDRGIRHGDVVDFAMPGGAFVEPDGDGLWYSAQVQEPAYSEWRPVLVNGEYEWHEFWFEGAWVDINTIGLQIDAQSGRIVGTASNLTQQTIRTRITAHDPHGGTVSGEFSLQVANTAPTVSAIPAQSLGRNQGWNFQAAAHFSDPNLDILTYWAGG